MKQNDIRAALESEGAVLPFILERRADERPDDPFVFYGEDDVHLTYAEARTIIDAIAGNLAAQGIGHGDRVSVFMSNQLVSLLWMFGIWRAGAVFCPINFSYEGRLLEYQINDTDPHLILVDRGLVPALGSVADELERSSYRVVVYDAAEGAHDYIRDGERHALPDALEELDYGSMVAPASPPDVAIEWDDPSSLFYTSGTTGPSKGVVHQHRWMNQYIYSLRAVTDRTDVIYNDLPLYHVGGAVFNIGRAVWVGASVAIWNRFSPSEFWNRIRVSRASSAVLLDVMIAWLLNAPESDTDREHTLDKVHMQPLPTHHDVFCERFGVSWVSVGFGQSEAGMPIFALIEELGGDDRPAIRHGQGLDNAQVKAAAAANGAPVIARGETVGRRLMGSPTVFAEAAVLNERDEECGPHEAGQLAIRTKLPGIMAQEYFRKPEATIAAFRNLWFHTGDAAIADEDGSFYFMDRLGDRIRVRGENLSSFQVEDILNRCPDIDLSAVFPVPSDEGDEDSIVAYVVPAGDAKLTEDAVREWCTAQMPKFMRPAHVRIAEDLPRTPTNKIEKYKLKREFAQNDRP